MNDFYLVHRPANACEAPDWSPMMNVLDGSVRRCGGALACLCEWCRGRAQLTVNFLSGKYTETRRLAVTWTDNLTELREIVIALLPLNQPVYHIYWILLHLYPRVSRREKLIVDMIAGLRRSYIKIKSQRC